MPNLETKQKVRIKILPAAIMVAGFAVLAAAGFGFVQLLKARKPIVPPSQTLTIPFVAPSATIAKESATNPMGTYMRVSLPSGAGVIEHAGVPNLPVLHQQVLLPPGAKVQSVRFQVTHQATQTIEAPVAPVQMNTTAVPSSPAALQEELTKSVTSSRTPTQPDQAIYAKNDIYPANPVLSYQQGQIGPYDVVTIQLVPFAYRPVSKELTTLTTGDLVVTYAPSQQRGNFNALYEPVIAEEAAQNLVNWEMADEWYGEVGWRGRPRGAVVNPVDLAIIKPDTYWHKLAVDYGGRTIVGTDANHLWRGGYGKDLGNNTWNNLSYYNGTDWSYVTLREGTYPFQIESMVNSSNNTVIAAGAVADQARLYVHQPAAAPTDFQPVSLPGSLPSSRLYDVAFISTTTALTVGAQNIGADGIMLRSAAPFTSWQTEIIPSVPGLRGVYAASANQVWAVGYSGTILYYNGTTWTTQSSGVSEDLYAVDGSGPTDVWAVGVHGTILHFTGSAWVNQTSQNPDRRWNTGPEDLTSIKVIDATHRYVASGYGALMDWMPEQNRWEQGYLERLDINESMSFDAPSSLVKVDGKIYVTMNERNYIQEQMPTTLLDEYVAYRRNQGYRVEVKTVRQIWSEFRRQWEGHDDLAESIRAYLQDRTTNRGLSSVLLIGSADLIPNMWNWRYQSDSYYQDILGPGGADGIDDLYVGRIPRDEPTEITDYLQRVISFEANAPTREKRALLTAAMATGCVSEGGMEDLRTTVLEPNGYNVRTIYGEEGYVGSPYPWTTIRDLVRQYWPQEQPLLVSMTAHGGWMALSHTFYAEDTQLLSNQNPAQVLNPYSCSTAGQQYYENVGAALIKQGGISYIGAVEPAACGPGVGAVRYSQQLIAQHRTVGESFSVADIEGGSSLIVYGDPLLSFSAQPISFTSPEAGKAYRATSNVPVVGSILGQGFSSYTIEWGAGAQPTSWSTAGITLTTPTERKILDTLGNWNVSGITTAGQYTLRVTGTYNGIPESQQITMTIDNQVCSDGTTPQQCSTVKPKLCEDGQLQDRCRSCGCANAGDTCLYNGSCAPGCSDGTPSQTCAITPGSYCSSTNTIIPLVTQCASEDGVAHSIDDCSYCGFQNNTYCGADGRCAIATPGQGLAGDYYQGEAFTTLVHTDVVDPVIDFGSASDPRIASHYLQTVLADPGRANTTGAASIRWDGAIYIPSNTSRTYYLHCSGTCSLYLQNLKTPFLTSMASDNATKTLGAGWYPIRLEYQIAEPEYGAGIQLGWKENGRSYPEEFGGMASGIPVANIIPASAFSPTMPVAPVRQPQEQTPEM